MAQRLTPMQGAIFATALAFVILLAGMTVSVVIESGFSVLTALSLVVLVLIGVGVIGALTEHKPDE